MVEIHCMEHGLLMLDGGGIYRLGEEWYRPLPVIYMDVALLPAMVRMHR